MSKYFLLIFLQYICFTLVAFSQKKRNNFVKENGPVFRVTAINIVGTKRTKNYIILRELPFKIGGNIQKNKFDIALKQAKTQVYNTNLFVDVNVDSALVDSNKVAINITVKERWYIFPVPQVVFVDRFNDWLKSYNADINRLVYGVKFTHNNFNGKRDKLSVTLLTGYAKNVSIAYNNPYINASLTQGFSLFANFNESKEIIYKTTFNNKILAYKKPDFVRNSFSIGGSYLWRKGFFKTVGLSVSLNNINIEDSILQPIYNPNYFNSDKRNQFFSDISFGISYINTNKNAYPTLGVGYNVSILKRGLGFSGGINSTRLQANVAKYFTHHHNFYSTIQVGGLIKIPFEQAYINQRAIGFGNLNMRGLELNNIDGVAAATASYTFSKRILSVKIPFPFKLKAVPYIPLNVFAKTYSDIGYCYIPNNYTTKLNNTFLYTGGIGIDIVSLYDIVFKVEYSFNQLGEKGVFLHGAGF